MIDTEKYRAKKTVKLYPEEVLHIWQFLGKMQVQSLNQLFSYLYVSTLLDKLDRQIGQWQRNPPNPNKQIKYSLSVLQINYLYCYGLLTYDEKNNVKPDAEFIKILEKYQQNR